MSNAENQTLETIPAETLLERAGELRKQGCRLVQIGATRLPEHVELTYSFDCEGRLANLRFQVPAAEARVPSITSIYWCAFLYENELHDLFNVRVDGMAVDFHGHLYETTVKFPFGSTRAPVAKPAPAAASAPPAAKQAHLAGTTEGAGVRPSPGAATSVRSEEPKPSSVPDRSEAAAPGDGRTPVVRQKNALTKP